MRRIAKHLAALLLAAPLGAELARAEPALAEQRSKSRSAIFGIQCAAASDLCAWKRIPGAGPIRRAPRVVRPARSPSRSPN
jgi:hypothetical protein